MSSISAPNDASFILSEDSENGKLFRYRSAGIQTRVFLQLRMRPSHPMINSAAIILKTIKLSP